MGIKVIGSFPRLIVAAASGLGATIQSPLVNALGFSDCVPLYVRVYASWSGMTGGDGTSSITAAAKFCQTDTVPAVGASSEMTLIGKQSTNEGLNPTVVFSLGAAPAASAETAIFLLPITNTYYGPLPIAPFVYVNLSNTGTAFTGGTVVLGIDLIG